MNGIWEKYTDTTDVNAAEANFQNGVVVTGDDFGQVKLVRFPCIKKGTSNIFNSIVYCSFYNYRSCYLNYKNMHGFYEPIHNKSVPLQL